MEHTQKIYRISCAVLAVLGLVVLPVIGLLGLASAEFFKVAFGFQILAVVILVAWFSMMRQRHRSQPSRPGTSSRD